MYSDEYKKSRSKCGFVGSIQKMTSVPIVDPNLQLRSIQKTVLDDQYGLPHQVSCGSFLPVSFDDNLPNLGESDVAIIGSQRNLAIKCAVEHSTKERVVTVHRYPHVLLFSVGRDCNNRRSVEPIQSINFDSIEKVLFFGGVT